MSRHSRRTFLKRSAAAGAAGLGIWASSRVTSAARLWHANEAVRVAVAGLHGRGGSHVAELLSVPGVHITYLVDPDVTTFAERVKAVEAAGQATPRTVQDIREALDDPNVDCVTIATPNHWHALMTIWACQAGKDVYVEKPSSHNVHEGRIAVEAARRYNRIVQHGTQSRSSAEWAGAIEFIRSGKAGKLHIARGLCYKNRPSIGFKPMEVPPAELDFNLWLGPAPDMPFHRNLVHYNWHWFWATGNGDIGNQGVHQMDIARWGIPGATLPKRVVSLGGRFGYEDQGETANTQLAFFDYGETQLIFEVRGLPTEGLHGQRVGNIFHCEEGMVIGNQFYPKGSDRPETIPSAPRGPGNGHFGNFIAAVRSRRQEDLNADILEGHYSSALCHLANISLRLGERVPFRPRTSSLGDNEAADEALARMEEHLESGNGLKLDGGQTYLLGRMLHIDSQAETIVDDSQAASLLTRRYREPFVVPDKLA